MPFKKIFKAAYKKKEIDSIIIDFKNQEIKSLAY